VSTRSTSARPGALVLGATYRALGVVRSLGRRGMPVGVVQTDDHVVAIASRYALRLGALPHDDEAQVAFLLGLAAGHDLTGWQLVATDDDSAALVARNLDALTEAFVTTSAPWDVVRAADDKRLTYEAGAAAGLPVPRTWLPRDAAEVAALDPAFPVIIKPAHKHAADALHGDKAWRVENAAELARLYAEACATLPADAVMVQELIPGAAGATQLSYGALCDRGRVVASITARRTRQRPMDFGKASTFVETIRDDEVEALAARLLEHLGFHGIVEVEFKRDPRDGLLKLLDVNPRTWGWQTLGAAAGVDFPWLDWLLARGEPVPETRARPGVRWVRATMDLPTALEEIAGGRMGLREALRAYRPPVEYATLARDDPRPALMDVPALAAIAARRRLRGG
jgi:predicted ATP-grasp superfamily ATP-dependent carboligase